MLNISMIDSGASVVTANIVSTVNNAVGNINNTIGTVTNTIGTVTNTIGTVTNTIGTVTNTVGSIANNITGTIQNVTGVVNNVTGTIEGVVNNVTGTIEGVVGGIVNNVTGAIEGVVGGVINGVTGAIEGVVGGVISDVTGAISNVTGAISNVTGAISNVTGAISNITNIGGIANNLAGGIVNNLAGGIVANSLGGIVGGALASGITGGLGSALGIMGGKKKKIKPISLKKAAEILEGINNLLAKSPKYRRIFCTNVINCLLVPNGCKSITERFIRNTSSMYTPKGFGLDVVSYYGYHQYFVHIPELMPVEGFKYGIPCYNGIIQSIVKCCPKPNVDIKNFTFKYAELPLNTKVIVTFLNNDINSGIITSILPYSSDPQFIEESGSDQIN